MAQFIEDFTIGKNKNWKINIKVEDRFCFYCNRSSIALGTNLYIKLYTEARQIFITFYVFTF
jgi:hypothetical protein